MTGGGALITYLPRGTGVTTVAIPDTRGTFALSRD